MKTSEKIQGQNYNDNSLAKDNANSKFYSHFPVVQCIDFIEL